MDRKCAIGLILGTGSNACYIERADRIEKWEGEHKDVKEVKRLSIEKEHIFENLNQYRSSLMSSGELSETMVCWTSSKQNTIKKLTEILCLLGPLRENFFSRAHILVKLFK